MQIRCKNGKCSVSVNDDITPTSTAKYSLLLHHRAPRRKRGAKWGGCQDGEILRVAADEFDTSVKYCEDEHCNYHTRKLCVLILCCNCPDTMLIQC